MKKLTPKQQAFADYYIELANATEAAIRAGYSGRYVGQNADKLLKNTKISNYIEKRMEEIKTDRIADQQEILELLTSVVRGEAKASTLIGVGGGAEDITNDMPPTMAERIKAAELLGKRYAMWTEKQQIEGNQTVVFVDDIMSDAD